MLACWLSPAAIWPAVQTGGSAPTKPDEHVFDARAAVQLLNQIAEGLVSRNQRMMLGAFDLSKMNDGPQFRQQINSLFDQTGTIRVHFNLTEAAMEDAKGAATVDLEMEADLRDDTRTPIRKQAQVHFVAEKTADGWKFTGVDPRAFFSTAQP
jgi:hypothetical protein